jgi:hypothetical protein
MIPAIPWYFDLISVAASLLIAVSVWTILSRAAGRSGLAPSVQRRVLIGAGTFLSVWLGAALLLAPSVDTLQSRNSFYLSPLIPLFNLGAIGVALLAIRLSPALRRVLASASLPALIGVQFYRVIGLEFVILLALGQLPAHFALPAGWGDIIVGLTAPLVALALARGARSGRALGLAWNVFGVTDLVVAVGMGTGFLAPLLAPELSSHVPPAAAMGVFPLILVPTFAVPVSLLLHGVALQRLRRADRPEARLVPGLAS